MRVSAAQQKYLAVTLSSTGARASGQPFSFPHLGGWRVLAGGMDDAAVAEAFEVYGGAVFSAVAPDPSSLGGPSVFRIEDAAVISSRTFTLDTF